MRLVPEESVRLRFAGEGDAEIFEIIAVAVRVEAGVGQFFSGERGNLTVLHVVLQKFADLLAAEVLG